jgi:uncharacterized membrane protein
LLYDHAMDVVVVVLRWLLAAAMIVGGVMHFIVPRSYERMVPKALPAHRAIVYVSGVVEVACGAALLVPSLSPWAAYAVIAVLVAIFPANINMAVNHISAGKKPMAPWMLWARLPLQFVLIAWAWWVR